MTGHRSIVVLLAICPSVLSLAQTAESPAVAAADATELVQLDAPRKRIEIFRTDLAPDLDGVLDDEIWRTATVISDLHQFQPLDGAEPSERSEFYIAFSERFFYIGARLYDSDPSGISARQLMQGGSVVFDDTFEFILDTFNSGRTGYHFQVNPNGVRTQGVYENSFALNREWNGIWDAVSRIDDQGWTAEVAVPFSTLNFDPQSGEWGFTIARSIARKQEDVAWSSFNRNINPTTTGLISGIRDIRQGMGLDIIPSIAMSASEDHVVGVTDERVDPSLDVFYKFTPNLTGALTINTDFSATEVDDRQVNLTRFSLFFPEKRDFFLQDVDIFSFGGRGAAMGMGGGGNQNGIPFYSRRIGLSPSGAPVDIDAGVKLTGRVGQWNVGTLAVRQGAGTVLDEQDLFVGRVSANVLGESTLGAIFTSGNPTSEIDNALVGADFRYQNTHFSDTHTFRTDVWYQQTDTEGRVGDDGAHGVSVNLNTQGNGFGGNLGYQHFGEDFYPALGFANRVGIERLSLGGNGRRFIVNHPIIRTLNTMVRYEYTQRLDTGELDSETLFWRPLNISTHRGDQGGIGVSRTREGLEEDFEIQPGIIIPAGEYSFVDMGIDLNISNQRNVFPSFSINSGEFYDGDREQVGLGIGWRPDEHFFMSVNYDYQDIELPAGAFEVKLVRANVNYAFNSKWSWVNLIQYDTASSSAGINSRLHFNPRAGDDLYIVINSNFDSQGVFRELSTEMSELSVKYTRTFRY